MKIKINTSCICCWNKTSVWRLSGSKFPQISSTFPSIFFQTTSSIAEQSQYFLVFLIHSSVWGEVSSTPTIMLKTLIFIFLSFFNSQERSWYFLIFYFLSSAYRLASFLFPDSQIHAFLIIKISWPKLNSNYLLH